MVAVGSMQWESRYLEGGMQDNSKWLMKATEHSESTLAVQRVSTQPPKNPACNHGCMAQHSLLLVVLEKEPASLVRPLPQIALLCEKGLKVMAGINIWQKQSEAWRGVQRVVAVCSDCLS